MHFAVGSNKWLCESHLFLFWGNPRLEGTNENDLKYFLGIAKVFQTVEPAQAFYISEFHFIAISTESLDA